MPVTAVRSMLARLVSHDGGTVAVVTGILFPLVIALGGAVVDYAAMHKQVTRLQAVADAAALSAAREMTIANADNDALVAIVNNYVDVASRGYRKGLPIKAATLVDSSQLSVTVSLSQDPTSFFYSIIYRSVTQLHAKATARVLGTTRICVLGLERSQRDTIVLKRRARMTGSDCAVFSNSASASGLHAMDTAKLRASLTCSAGGYLGTETNFEPLPISDCPRVDDPLIDRPEPEFDSKCSAEFTNVQILGTEKVTLDPGTYCGGIKIGDDAQVFLNPGVYVMKDGALRVVGRAAIRGRNVGFFFTGRSSRFFFGKPTTIELTAPETGALAGLLFFESRNQQTAANHQITSNNARLLLGTIYLPVNGLTIDATDVVADESAYTVIIAKTLKLFDGPHLVLNADYDQTDVPVPDGIANRGNHVGLVN